MDCKQHRRCVQCKVHVMDHGLAVTGGRNRYDSYENKTRRTKNENTKYCIVISLGAVLMNSRKLNHIHSATHSSESTTS